MILLRTRGFSGFLFRSNQITERLGNFRAPMREALRTLRDWIQDNIRGGGALAGGWAPLTRSTVRRKAAHWGHKGPLRRTDDLLDNWRIRIDGRVGYLTSEVDYATFHQHGTSRMVARRILPTIPEAEALIRPIFGRHVRVSLRG